MLLASPARFERAAFRLGVDPNGHREVKHSARKSSEIQGFSPFSIPSGTTLCKRFQRDFTTSNLPKLANRPIFGGRCKYKKISLCSYSLCEVIGSPNLSGTTARWFLRRIKCCYYSISAPFFQEEITWNSAYFFGLNRYVKTKKQGQNLLRLCKRICPCGCYKVLASDFKSAAISGFCRSFRSNSLSSVELSCAAVCTGSGVACLPE